MAGFGKDREGRRHARQIFLWGGLTALVLFVGISVWPLLAPEELDSAAIPEQTENRPASERTTGVRTDNLAGESRAGRQGSATSLDAAGDDRGGRGQDIQKTARGQPAVTSEQQEMIQAFLQSRAGESIESANFTISIGAAVPEQAPLKDIPSELSRALPDYQGDQYLQIGDQLIIVEKPSRRIVAIIPVSV